MVLDRRQDIHIPWNSLPVSHTSCKSCSSAYFILGHQTPRDCFDVRTQNPNSTSGVYTVYPGAIRRGLDVLCDMDADDGGWLVSKLVCLFIWACTVLVYKDYVFTFDTYFFWGRAMFCSVCRFYHCGCPWQVIQKRTDGSLDFFRDWTEYQFGFSNQLRELWLG